MQSPLPTSLPKECAKAAQIFSSFSSIIPNELLRDAKGVRVFPALRPGAHLTCKLILKQTNTYNLSLSHHLARIAIAVQCCARDPIHPGKHHVHLDLGSVPVLQRPRCNVVGGTQKFAILVIAKAGFLFSARAGSGVVIVRLPDGCKRSSPPDVPRLADALT